MGRHPAGRLGMTDRKPAPNVDEKRRKARSVFMKLGLTPTQELTKDEPLTAEEEASLRQRRRSMAIAWGLALLVVLFYALTVSRFKAQ
jgi:hypothetical protein